MSAATPIGQAFAQPGSADQTATYTPGGISSFQRFGFSILVVYLFLIYSRIFDVKFAFLHIPGISYRVMFAMVILSQAFLKALKWDIGKALLGLTVWFVLSIPTSLWRGGSTQLLINTWVPAFVIFLATAGLVGNYDQCKKAITAVAYGFMVLTGIAMVWGSTEDTGRLYLPQGKFANPNEMGQALLLGMALWLYMFHNAQSGLRKAFAGVMMLLMLFTMTKTGSRGALIGLAVLILSLFLRSSPGGKLKLMMGGTVLLVVILGTMPARLLNRYKTLTEDQEEITDPEDNAYSSAEARKDLLRKSIRYTFHHPIFGVGPGMFVVAEDAEAREAGARHGRWQGTHNSYTQVSSECGIPAMVFYAAAIFFSLRTSSRIYRRTRGDPNLSDIAHLALGLNYAMIVYAVTVTFDYIAYTSMLPVFAGLITALASTVDAEIARRTAAPVEPQATITPVRGLRPAISAPYQLKYAK